MILADLHIHSTFSDGSLTIPELVDFYGARGFGAIAITDHLCEETSVIGTAARYLGRTLTRASFPLYLGILKSEAERAFQQYGMVVIPGFELTKNSLSNHRSAHIIALGVEEYIPSDGDPLDLAREIRSKGGLAIAAHPVHTRIREKQTYHLWDRREELAQEFDAWEVASGPYLFDEVLRSKLPKIAVSDLHRPEQIRSWKTVFRCERSAEAIFEAIRRQELDFQFFDDEEVEHGTHIRSDVRNLGRERAALDLRNLLDLEALSSLASASGCALQALSDLHPEAPERQGPGTAREPRVVLSSRLSGI